MAKPLTTFPQEFKDKIKELYGERAEDQLYTMHLESELQDLLGWDKYVELCKHAHKESKEV